MALPQFPSTSSIPPACFYTAQGLAGWLNQNPQYKENFSGTGAFPFLVSTGVAPSTASSIVRWCSLEQDPQFRHIIRRHLPIRQSLTL